MSPVAHPYEQTKLDSLRSVNFIFFADLVKCDDCENFFPRRTTGGYIHTDNFEYHLCQNCFDKSIICPGCKNPLGKLGHHQQGECGHVICPTDICAKCLTCHSCH